MCGRYRLSRRKQMVEEYFETVSDEPDWPPRYNVAPTQPVPVIRQNPKEPVRQLSLLRWGLIPSWAKGMSGAAMMINARSETASTKPAFSDSLINRRCLIPADGFYLRRRQPIVGRVGLAEAGDILHLRSRFKSHEDRLSEHRDLRPQLRRS
jgi:putative SOS response-associated peptidase YedK